MKKILIYVDKIIFSGFFVKKYLKLKMTKFQVVYKQKSDVEPCNFFQRGTIAYFEGLNLSYNYIYKSGNSNIYVLIEHILKESFFLENKDFFESGKNIREYYSQKWIKKVLESNSLKDFDSSTKFTFVRNPYSRTLSMYRDKIVKNKIIISRKNKQFTDDAKGFGIFLKFLKEGGTSFNSHFLPQSEFVFICLNQFDFIGKLENFSDDFKTLMSIINYRLSPKLINLINNRVNTNHVTFSENRLDEYYNSENYELVNLIYYKDFKNFNYQMVQ